MSTIQPTFDDVWRMFQETDRKFQETDRLIKGLFASQKETDHKFQETDRKFQETDRKFQETDQKIQENDRRLTLKIEKVTEAIGKLGNRLGDFVEDAVRPVAVRLFRERGIDVHEVHQNIEAQRANEGIEIDLLAANDTDVVAIECKSNLTVEDVKDHIKRLARLKRLLPLYADKRVVGAVAGMVISDSAAKYAYRHGLYVIGQSGEHLVIRNNADFTPTVW
ncbi:DUF3782 domain-containing protein [Gammaproteobacteria bacterium]